MQEAEFRLPTRQQTNIYINKIKTEGQAAEYISKVTAKLHPQSAPGGTARKIREQAIPAAAALRAGGFPQVFLLFAWGGSEGHHIIGSMNTSLLGGSSRPSLY
jgi:hypothetical protein